MEYLLLLSASFLSATMLPFASEAFLYGYIKQGLNLYLLLLIATTGNTLGALLNWWLGRHLMKYQHEKWFYFSPHKISQAQMKFKRYGLWTLLFTWVPIIGDPLTLVAGMLKVRCTTFLILVTLGKALRYGSIAWLAT